MISLKIVPPIVEFSIIVYLFLKGLSTLCGNLFDINLSLAGLVISLVIEIIVIIRNK